MVLNENHNCSSVKMNNPVIPSKPVKAKPGVGSRRKPVKVKPKASSEHEPVKVKSRAGPELEPTNAKPDASPERKPRTRSTRQGSKKAITKQPIGNFRHRLLLITFEVLGLSITAVTAIMLLLGYSANRFSGTSFFASLLPFAIGVLALILVTT